jgi:hypothetical protein
MPQAPIYTSWLIQCRDATAAGQFSQRLTELVDLDRTFEDVVRTATGGVEKREVVRHRLGDYFSAIRRLPVESDATSWRLVFARRPDAGRFWKDLMVNIVQQVENEVETAGVTLAYKGDEAPTELATGAVVSGHVRRPVSGKMN